MHIIFGKEQLRGIDDKFTILKLDTIRMMPQARETDTFCVVENIPFTDCVRIEEMKNLHENLLVNYYKKDWNYCEQAIQHLLGFWGGELDTFYTELQNRISNFKNQAPDDDWDGVIEKTFY